MFYFTSNLPQLNNVDKTLVVLLNRLVTIAMSNSLALMLPVAFDALPPTNAIQ